MSTRRATQLAWALVLLTVALIAAWIWLLVLNVESGLGDDLFSYTHLISDGAPAVAYMVVGLLVATRKPENPIGWLLLVAGPVNGLPLLAQQYAAYDLLAGGASLPGARVVAISLNGFWLPGLFVLLLIALLFPTGRLPTRRWRFVVWQAAIAGTVLFLISHIAKELDPPFSRISNPLELELDGNAVATFLVVVGLVVGIVGVFASAIAACACVVVRFRRSRGDEREQLKWFVFAAAALPVGIAVHIVAESLAPGALSVIEPGFSLATTFLPIAIGIAILKYRLYEIDRIISRTLVYGVLTVVLGAVYIGFVLAGQELFSSFAGGSNLAIAASTLAVAGLFLPARSRVQHFVDRRFYRRRYDAQRTLAAFGSRLRQQVELDGLSEDLLRAVAETMQPVSASLWLNDSRTTAKVVTIP
jgi:hypothetical protein